MTSRFIDGAPVTAIGSDDRGLHYGDGLFETIAIRGGEPRFWQSHYARLARGCKVLRLPLPDQSWLSGQIDGALESSGLTRLDATVKIILTAGQGPRGYERPADLEATVLVGAEPPSRFLHACYTDGVAVRSCETPIALQPVLAGLKTLNRLEQVLARAEWQDESIFEGLMQDTDGRLICGTMSNVFIVSDNAISTPSLARCGVAGVMREQVIAAATSVKLGCAERDIDADELSRADEVFLTNSQFGILPVNRCGSMAWSVGPVTRRLMQEMADSGVTECSN